MFLVEEAIQKAYGVTPDQFDQAVKAYYHSLTPLFCGTRCVEAAKCFAQSATGLSFPVPVGRTTAQSS